MFFGSIGLLCRCSFFVAISAAGVKVLAVGRRSRRGYWCSRGQCVAVCMSDWRVVGERGGGLSGDANLILNLCLCAEGRRRACGSDEGFEIYFAKGEAR